MANNHTTPSRSGSKIAGTNLSFDEQFIFLQELDPAFGTWQSYASEWHAKKKPSAATRVAICAFFVDYLFRCKLDLDPKALFVRGAELPDLKSLLLRRGISEPTAVSYMNCISGFLEWVLRDRLNLGDAGSGSPGSARFANPIVRTKVPPRARGFSRAPKTTTPKINGTNLNFDREFGFLLNLDPAFQDWKGLAAQWFAEEKNRTTRRIALCIFFIDFIHSEGVDKQPRAILDAKSHLPSLWDKLIHIGLNEKTADSYHDIICDFVDWVLRGHFAVVDADGHRITPPDLINPFIRRKRKQTGVGVDVRFSHFRRVDPRMERWCDFGHQWLLLQGTALSTKLESLHKFFERYVIALNLPRDPLRFLAREAQPLPEMLKVLVDAKFRGAGSLTPEDVKCVNHVIDFLDWVLQERLSFEDESTGKKIVPAQLYNPFNRLSYSGVTTPSESVRSPLSIRHVKELRGMLAEGPHFRNWAWAQEVTTEGNTGSSWFAVDPSLVNKEDLDCVWRTRQATKWEIQEKGLSDVITEIWSPVRAVALYVKLELPLRTFQVRMLDSGEADTWRYIHDGKSGRFVLNESPLAVGNAKRPSQKGVFHRANSETGAGLFVNTNKTADIGKNEGDKGYVIPWTHQEVLYWLEKLRNWQERYNPISAPTPWTSLERKHFNRTPPIEDVLAAKGTACFLFRDAAGEGDDRQKPLPASGLDRIWLKLLGRLEEKCAARGEALSDGTALRFLDPENDRLTLYPLHSLRVSLISYLVLDLQLPLAIVSKLIAGHSRIIMTLYYTKYGRTFLREVLDEAERRHLDADQKNHTRWIKDATLEQLETRLAYLSPDALRTAMAQRSTASFVFDDKGICPVGGALCDIGGEQTNEDKKSPLYAPVPGWPQERNCVRCRFFLTSPAFLSGLLAHFNQLSYQAHDRAERHSELEEQVQNLENRRSDCEREARIFPEVLELQKVHQRFEAETESLGKVINDLQATYYLLKRGIAILEMDHKGLLPLVAAGTISDIQLGLIESPSALHQLEILCENAVIYPEIDARKPTLERSQLLDVMLELNDMSPVFFKLETKQQLAAGNALMQLIQARTGSLAGSLDFVEGTRRLSEIGLLDDAYEVIADAVAGTPAYELIEVAKAKFAPSSRKKEILT